MLSRRTKRKVCRTMRTSLATFMTAEMALALAVAVMTAGAHLAGFETYDVLSGSMEPNIHTGSLVYVKTGIACERVRIDDVIAFDIGNGRTVTHRVTDIDPQSHTFVTKGDANAAADPPAVPWSSVRGMVVASVPSLGDAMNAFTVRKGHFIVAIVSLNALLCMAQRFIAELERRY